MRSVDSFIKYHKTPSGVFFFGQNYLIGNIYVDHPDGILRDEVEQKGASLNSEMLFKAQTPNLLFNFHQGYYHGTYSA